MIWVIAGPLATTPTLFLWRLTLTEAKLAPGLDIEVMLSNWCGGWRNKAMALAPH